MARLGIDAHAIGDKLTGNETYISNLIDSLAELGMEHTLVPLFSNEDARQEWDLKHPGIESVLMRPRQSVVRIPFVMPWLAWRIGLDLVHVQYMGPPILGPPLVVVIHDISFEKHPEFFSKKEVLQFRFAIPLTARRAKKVLTISEHSKRDLVEIYGLPEQKVEVTYLGVNSRFQPDAAADSINGMRTRYGIAGNYILAVGNLQPRKNLVRLIEAYTRLRNAQSEVTHQLVIVGKKTFKHDPILDFARRSRWNDDIIFTGYVTDEDLPAIYADASLMVYPSLYEGFGLPPLEAMASGTPVVVSDRASLPEVVGEAGLKVDPLDIESIATAMATVLLEPDLALRLRTLGLERSKLFTWEKPPA